MCFLKLAHRNAFDARCSFTRCWRLTVEFRALNSRTSSRKFVRPFFSIDAGTSACAILSK
jgi:hypothetical protein